MQSQIIATLDGLTNAEAILPHALFFARETQSVLTLLRVMLPPGEPAYDVPSIPDNWSTGEASWTRNYLGGLAARLESGANQTCLLPDHRGSPRWHRAEQTGSRTGHDSSPGLSCISPVGSPFTHSF